MLDPRKPLTKRFETHSRDEVVMLAGLIADQIKERLRRGEGPIIFKVDGDVDAGKSLFWDMVVLKLFGGRAAFLANKSNSSHEGGRIFEVWHGQIDEAGSIFKVFAGNIGAVLVNQNVESNKTVYSALKDENYASLGDVLLLNNLEATNVPEGFVSVEHIAFEISLFNDGDDPEAWCRIIDYSDSPAECQLVR